MAALSVPVPTTLIELLRRMVACNTVNPAFGGPAGGQAELATLLEPFAKTWGLSCERVPVGDAFNLLISCEVGATAEWLLFDSHLDTVAADRMTVSPFELKEAGDRLYGRGACDTKGSGAAMLWALRDYAASTDRPRNVGLWFTVDEEVAMAGARLLAPLLRGRHGANIRGIVVGEPTELHTVTATNGIVRWKTVARGVAAHSSDPAKGASAISAMRPTLDSFEDRYAPTITASHPLTGKAAASLNVIRGGSQINVIPDHCEVECDRRLIPGETVAGALAERDRLITLSPGSEHVLLNAVPPLPESASLSLHRWMTPILASLEPGPAPTGAAYVTNGSIFAEQEIPVVVLGPGHVAQAHTKDEWVSQEQLRHAASLYGALMEAP